MHLIMVVHQRQKRCHYHYLFRKHTGNHSTHKLLPREKPRCTLMPHPSALSIKKPNHIINSVIPEVGIEEIARRR